MRYLTNITIENFGNHEHTNLALKNVGLYVFTGDNGAGKSTIIDAIIWCLYHRSIRSKSKWKPNNEKTNVVLHFSDGLVVSRDTKSKVLENGHTYVGRLAINRIIELFGPYKEFIRSFILHKRYVSQFSMATDNEKKVVLESILGFDLLEEAHIKVKKSLKEFNYILDKLNMKARSIEYDLTGLERSISDANEFLVLDYSEELNALQSELDAPKLYEVPIPPSTENKDVIAKNIGEKKAHIRRLEKSINEYECSINNIKCVLCGSTNFDLLKLKAFVTSKKSLLDCVIDELEALQIEYDKISFEYDKDLIKYRDAWAECKLIGERRNMKNSRLDYLKSHEKNRLKSINNIEVLEKALLDKEKEYELLKYKQNILLNKIERYKIYCSLYSNKGLRLKLLCDVLSIISKRIVDIYNTIWFAHIEHKNKFKPIIKEKNNSINISILKGDKTISYSGLSEGEKGIFDIAILKSLFYLSPKKTIFPIVYDDIFDAFDDTVTDKLINYVCNEAKKCPVFIITHNTKLLDNINNYDDNVKHYHVTNGCINGA